MREMEVFILQMLQMLHDVAYIKATPRVLVLKVYIYIYTICCNVALSLRAYLNLLVGGKQQTQHATNWLRVIRHNVLGVAIQMQQKSNAIKIGQESPNILCVRSIYPPFSPSKGI